MEQLADQPIISLEEQSEETTENRKAKDPLDLSQFQFRFQFRFGFLFRRVAHGQDPMDIIVAAGSTRSHC